jgi:hypothetical protein
VGVVVVAVVVVVVAVAVVVAAAAAVVVVVVVLVVQWREAEGWMIEEKDLFQALALQWVTHPSDFEIPPAYWQQS